MLSHARTRLLFQVYNRRGLGHLMRGWNLAREIRSLASSAELVFHTRTPPPEEFHQPSVRFLVDSEGTSGSAWRDLLRSFDPHVVVYDTMLPENPAAEPTGLSTRRVYIMRRCLARRSPGASS